jgi:hypothetical protein
LEKFLKLPVDQRLKELDNVALTAEDRSTLRRSFVGALERRKRMKWFAGGPGRLQRWWGRSRHRAPLVARLVLVAFLVVVPALTAWRNTARTVAVGARVVIDWESADRKLKSSSAVLPGGLLFVVRRLPTGGFLVRKWVSGTGYMYAPVDIIGDF